MLAEVERLGTIAAAAQALHLTAPGVSMQLAALEREVGLALTERRGRRVALTPAGQLLARHGRDIVDQVEVAAMEVAALREGTAGTYRVAAFPTAARSFVAQAWRQLVEEPASGPALRLVELEPIDSLPALAAGEVDFFIADVTFKDKAKLLALTVAERSPVLPDIPSSAEAGLDNFDLGAWWGIWLPAGAPQNVVDKLADLTDAFTASAENHEFTFSRGNQPWVGVRGKALEQYTIAEIEKWGNAIKAAKIEPQ